MSLPNPPSFLIPIPNSPFYWPPTFGLNTPTGLLIVGSGLAVSGNYLNVTGGGGGGGVSEVTAGVGIVTNPATGIIDTGTIGLATVGIAAASYDYVRRVSFDAFGRLNAPPTLYATPPVLTGAYPAKGAILAASGAGVPVNVAIGGPGTVLTADPASATGVRWVLPSPGGVETIAGSGSISVIGTTNAIIGVAIASATTVGVMQPGTGLTATAGIVSVNSGSVGQAGILQVGQNINVDSNSIISVADGAIGTPGVVALTDSLALNDDTIALTASAGAALQTQINNLSISGGLTLAGTLNGNTGKVSTVTTAGAAKGFTVGADLPAAAAGLTSYFVVVDTAGVYTPPGGTPDTVNPGDWYVCSGTAWEYIPIGSSSVPDASTTVKGIVRLAEPGETQAGTDDTIAVTPLGLSSLEASEFSPGLALLATQLEVNIGENDFKVVTPSTLNGRIASTSLSGLARYATQEQVNAGSEASLVVSPQTLLGIPTSATQRGPVFIADDVLDPVGPTTAITYDFLSTVLNEVGQSEYAQPGTILQGLTTGPGPGVLPIGTAGQMLEVNPAGNQLRYTGTVDGGSF
jgi:hypothetical protein